MKNSFHISWSAISLGMSSIRSLTDSIGGRRLTPLGVLLLDLSLVSTGVLGCGEDSGSTSTSSISSSSCFFFSQGGALRSRMTRRLARPLSSSVATLGSARKGDSFLSLDFPFDLSFDLLLDLSLDLSLDLPRPFSPFSPLVDFPFPDFSETSVSRTLSR